MGFYVLFLLIFSLCFDLNHARKPEIDALKSFVDLEEHESFQLMCSIRKGSKPISFEWLKNNERIEDEHDSMLNIIHNPTSSILSFDNVLRHHSGNYSCRASNSDGFDQSSTIIHVKGLFFNLCVFDRDVALWFLKLIIFA